MQNKVYEKPLGRRAVKSSFCLAAVLFLAKQHCVNNPLSAQLFSPTGQLRETYRAPAQISGYEYEVDAAVKAIRAGGTECTQMPHSETLFVMELLDRLRREWGVKYPEDM